MTLAVNAPEAQGEKGGERKRRRGQHLATAKDALRQWRIEQACTCYPRRSFSLKAILPDDLLTSLASDARVRTLPDVRAKADKVGWAFFDRHGQQVLDVLRKVDADYQLEQLVKKRSQQSQANSDEAPLDIKSDDDDELLRTWDCEYVTILCEIY